MVDLLRKLHNHAGRVLEDCELISVQRNGKGFVALVAITTRNTLSLHAETFVMPQPRRERFACRWVSTRYIPCKTGFHYPPFAIHGCQRRTVGNAYRPQKLQGFVAVATAVGKTGQVIGCASPAVDPMEADKT